MKAKEEFFDEETKRFKITKPEQFLAKELFWMS
jgi:hypothetical protein